MTTPLGTFGPPPDAVAWVSLVLAGTYLGAYALFRLRPNAFGFARISPRAMVVGLAAAGVLLSVGYVEFYLKGGPRIIDATSYFLQARALSEGLLSFEVPAPTGAFRGRFLVTTAESESTLAVIFPPGYPAFLSLGFWLGRPMLAGPLLGGALVLATYWLGHVVTGRPRVALIAALLSTACAALRYHTADTMSHGLSALLVTLTLCLLLSNSASHAALAGLAAGWALATRPVTGLALLLLAAWLLRRHAKHALLFAAGLTPFATFLLVHQHAVTGSLLSSSQLRYYALADGPPGCFRYGFGEAVGCRFEHGDFVRAFLARGYGLGEAFLGLFRRLSHHAGDITNAAPLALLVPVALIKGRSEPRLRLLGALVLIGLLAYAPFYFDGNYPGGGARFLIELVPAEQVLLAWLLSEWKLGALALPASLLGFSLNTAYAHGELSRREGGRPMFEPEVLSEAGVARGLVLLDTDHGFNLAFDPGRLDPLRSPVAARFTGDARVRALWERLGRPAVYRYRFAPESPRAVPRVEPFDPLSLSPLRFEAEHEWPLLAVDSGWAHPDYPPYPNVSNRRALALKTAAGVGRYRIELFGPQDGEHELGAGICARMPHRVTFRLAGSTVALRADEPGCSELSAGLVTLDRGSRILEIEGGGFWLDYIELRPSLGSTARQTPPGSKSPLPSEGKDVDN